MPLKLNNLTASIYFMNKNDSHYKSDCCIIVEKPQKGVKDD